MQAPIEVAQPIYQTNPMMRRGDKGAEFIESLQKRQLADWGQHDGQW
jgi:hypothetical protein